jgi:voltage-gated potassium channel
MQRYRYFWFLLSLIAMLVLAPIAERVDIAITHQVLFTIVVLLALNTATDRRNHWAVAAVCAVSWLILDWSSYLFGWPLLRVPAGIVFFCLLFVVLYDILRLLLRVRQTDFNLLSAGVAAYLLLGVAWAASFDVIERVMPGSFHALDAQQWSEFLYFSMATLTTLGYGDITPANPIAGIWAALEATCGVLYLAVLISHLVSRVRG